MADLNGQTIDHYRIERFIGQGGMGSVYEAHDLSLQRQVAIKIIHTHLAVQSEFRELFLQKIRTIARFDHPNIVRILAHDYKDNQLFIVMEYIPGENLRTYLDNQVRSSTTVRPDAVIEIGLQAAEALKVAYEQGISHRNLKPENIHFKTSPHEKNAADLRIVVSDFGLEELSSELKATTVGFPTAFFAYMSPEQASGQKVDHRTDVYALGTILYELSTGRTPFSPKSLPEAFNMLQNKELVPPSRVNTHIPSNLEAIILRCLIKDQQARYQTADALTEDLLRIRTSRYREEVVEVAVLPDLDYEDTDMVEVLHTIPPSPPPPPAEIHPEAAQIPLKTEAFSRPAERIPFPSAAESPVSMPAGGTTELVIVQDRRPVLRVLLDSESKVIGRDDACDIALDHHRISRRHLKLERSNDAYYITDLQSTNGTWLDNVQLPPNQRTRWPQNAIVRIGDLWLSIDHGQPPEQMVTHVFTGPEPAVRGKNAAPSHRVDAVLIPELITLEPGSIGNVLLEIINDSPEANHFQVRVHDLPAAWVTQPEHSIRVDAHQSSTVNLTLHPLRTSSSLPGSRSFYVEISGLNASRLNTRVTGQIQVTEFTLFNVEMRPPRLYSRRQGFIILSNLGNRPASYWIAADLYQGDIDFEIPGDSIAVPAGQIVSIPVRVIAQRRPLLFGIQESPFTFIINDDEGNENQLGGVLVAQPLIPVWLVLLSSLIILFACVTASGIGYSQYTRIQNENSTATTIAEAANNRATVVAFQATTDASDPDGDTLSNVDEAARGTDPENPDTDSDGLNDGDEISGGTNPLLFDTDSDGLSDRDEVQIFSSNPLSPDSDGDGLSDSDEVRIYRTEPTLADTDNDGLPDAQEIQGGFTSPVNPDSDSDGIRDNEDPNSSGIPDPVRPDEFVRLYYVQINNRDYASAWPLLTPRFREENGQVTEEQFAARWDTVGRVVIGDIRIVTEDAVTACVDIDLTYELTNGARVVEDKRYIVLLLDQSTNTWHIDEQISGHP